MSNYQRCKIRLYPRAGRCDLEALLPRVEVLQREGRIFENIRLVPGDAQRFVELRFTARSFPYMIDDIFSPQEFDIWSIKSDEGGGADRLQRLSDKADFSPCFEHKALYRFDRIDLLATTALRVDELRRIFGHGADWLRASQEGAQRSIVGDGLYTNNGFYYGDGGGQIVVAAEDAGGALGPCGEFWDMMFHADHVEFLDRFYAPARRAPAGERIVDWLLRVDFSYAGRLSNRIVWRAEHGGGWEHRSADGFWNLANPEWCAAPV